MKVCLSLGSNVGDRRGNIELALEAISALPTTSVQAVSEIMRTQPLGQWNTPNPAYFLNCCCIINTGIPPLRLLDMLQGIERRLGRPAHEAQADATGERVYSDRTIDIDILLYGRRHIDTARLTVPHPHIQERPFILDALRQLQLLE